jgi:hypothetical protein
MGDPSRADARTGPARRTAVLQQPHGHQPRRLRLLGDTLEETLRSFPLGYGACHTCHVYGVTCRT